MQELFFLIAIIPWGLIMLSLTPWSIDKAMWLGCGIQALGLYLMVSDSKYDLLDIL